VDICGKERRHNFALLEKFKEEVGVDILLLRLVTNPQK